MRGFITIFLAPQASDGWYWRWLSRWKNKAKSHHHEVSTYRVFQKMCPMAIAV